MSPDELEELASGFFAAIERGDTEAVRGIYDPGVAVWHNVTGVTQSRDENLALLRVFTERVRDLRYEEVERRFFPGGFVQRHVVRGKLASGEPVEIPVGIIIEASGGRITGIYEYLDSTAVAGVFADRT